MTMENGGDGVEGNELDAQQAALENIEPQGPTNAQFKQLADTVGELLQATRSSQGLTSKGLDAVRRDMASEITALRGEVGTITNAARRSWIGELPEEQQEMAKRLLAEVDRSAPKAEPSPEPQRDEPNGEQDDAVAAWEAIYASARMFGLDPRDPNIDYSMWTDTGISDTVRNDKFAKSLRSAILKGGNAQQPNGAPPPQQRAAAPKNPPTNGAPAGGSASQSFEQLRDKFISGTMAPEVYRDEAAKLGVNV